MEIFKSTDPASQTESAAESAQLFFAEMLGDPLAYDRSTGAAAELCRKAEIDSLQDLLVGDVTDSAQMVFRLPSKPNRPTLSPLNWTSRRVSFLACYDTPPALAKSRKANRVESVTLPRSLTGGQTVIVCRQPCSRN